MAAHIAANRVLGMLAGPFKGVKVVAMAKIDQVTLASSRVCYTNSQQERDSERVRE